MNVISTLMEIIKTHFDSEVKFYDDGNQVLVHMMDMANILMLPKNSRDVAAIVWAEYRFQLANGVGKPAWYVTEPGLYQLIFASNHTNAVKIQRWVFEDVLPSIRAKGGYISPTASAEQLEGLMAEIESLQKQLNYATRGRDALSDLSRHFERRLKTRYTTSEDERQLITKVMDLQNKLQDAYSELSKLA